MAVTQNTYTGNGSNTNFSITFEYLKQADVKASIDGTATTAFTFANATTLSFNTAPANGAAVRIFRDTEISSLKATFFPGSAIKAEDLNDNFTQNNFAVQEADFDVSTANTTANTAKTTADAATATANTASTNASNAVTTANTASTNASAAVSTANTASTNASNAVTTANSAATDAATAITTANSATTTANSATTTANAATATANSAVTTANSAASDATAAVSTANTASTNASSAVSTANSANTTAASAVTTANAATATANTASTNASAAVSTANTASTNASNAVTTANSAASDATSAVSTANTASTNASNAVTTANTASTNATAALNNSRESDGQGGFTSAIDKANAAITASNTATAAVSNAVLFDLIANVSSIPGSPSNNDYIEIGNSTGIQNFTPLSGLPTGFVGAAGLTVRLRYDSSATSWVFMNYFANDSETRYVAIGNPNPTYYANQAAFPSATTYHGGVAHSHADGAMYYAHGGNWIKMAKDSDVTTNATNISSNTTSINTNSTNISSNTTSINTNSTNIGQRLQLAGGTMTGNLILNGAPTGTNQAATKGYVDTEVAGLVDSAPGTLDTLNELAAALGDDANFSTTVTNSIATKMPLAGGTFTGNVTLNADLDMQDNDKILLGTGDDLEIFHDGSNSYISDTGVGNLYITSTDGNINLQTNASENAVKCIENGAVELYYDGSRKLYTKSDGVDITGELQSNSLDCNGAANIHGDLIVDGTGRGTGNVYTLATTKNDGTNGLLMNTSGELWVRDKVKIGSSTTSPSISLNNNGSASFNGTVTLHNNLDLQDDDRIKLGTDDDLQIYHDGGNSRIVDSGVGSLVIASSRVHMLNAAQNAVMLNANDGGSVELYHNGVRRFETTSGGASVIGTLTSSGVITAQAGAVAQIDTLSSASTITPNFANSCNFTVTLGTNTTIANPSNLTAGQSGSIFIVQDGTGSRTAAFGSYWDFAGGAAPTLTTTANGVDRIDYIVRSSTSIHAVATLAYS